MVQPPAIPERQPSEYSLPERSSASIVRQAEHIAHDDGDAASITSSRSDQSEEAAGLVSRLSDDEDRASRRAKYEGQSRLGSAHAPHGRTGAYRLSEDDVLDEEERLESEAGELLSEGNGIGRDHSIAPSDVRDGVFRDRSADAGGAERIRRRRKQSERSLIKRTWEIAREALPTLSLSLISLVLSGELLIHIAKWPVFSKVDKLFILIPILLNLKGNLEGNLSLRMSTSANIGELDVRRTRETLIFGNMALLQVQALIVSLFAGILSFLLGLGTSGGAEQGGASLTSRVSPRRVIHHHPQLDPSLKLRNSYFEFVLVIATAMLSASLSSAILGSFMCALVVVTRQVGGNPDNIASPLAGSLGDLLTLSLLGLLSSFMVRFEGTILATLILLGLAVACAVCFVAAYRNAYVRELLSSGWIPLLVAMFIASGAGVILDAFVQKFEGFALLVPVVTGLPGAVSAIFVSRTSTALHGGLGSSAALKPSVSRRRSFGGGRGGRILRWILAIGGPAEGWIVPLSLFGLGMTVTLTFIGIIKLTGQMSFGVPFFLMFGFASVLQFASSLAIAHVLTITLWRYDYDPDIYCLPYVTSLVDVIGQVLLVGAYYIAISMGDHITAAVNEGHK